MKRKPRECSSATFLSSLRRREKGERRLFILLSKTLAITQEVAVLSFSKLSESLEEWESNLLQLLGSPFIITQELIHRDRETLRCTDHRACLT